MDQWTGRKRDCLWNSLAPTQLCMIMFRLLSWSTTSSLLPSPKREGSPLLYHETGENETKHTVQPNTLKPFGEDFFFFNSKQWFLPLTRNSKCTFEIFGTSCIYRRHSRSLSASIFIKQVSAVLGKMVKLFPKDGSKIEVPFTHPSVREEMQPLLQNCCSLKSKFP